MDSVQATTRWVKYYIICKPHIISTITIPQTVWMQNVTLIRALCAGCTLLSYGCQAMMEQLI